ncbi:DUF1667 domain-containing protein [Calorimonas adulescens]|jgi:Protein of unknown function (DUF1667).|uniref:DUF1667 domain-containing protein n=1 Tax=Calorimonas adulescens TaxID=2606906 RepID=A0A5D8QEL9_9THEO|nr:DUF1667 domain-containing protein [Calorimonas adulescens]TZE83015.1 DUF1667 domain-containing protein [Calorimonas adulescens]
MQERYITCILCPQGCNLKVQIDDGKIVSVKNNGCEKGPGYANDEVFHPTRVLTTTVRIRKAKLPLLPVRTKRPIPKGKIFEAMKVLAGIEVEAPVTVGQVIYSNILDTGVDVVATRDMN